MKCPKCNKIMEKGKDMIKEDNIEFELYRCRCGEELMDMKQLHSLTNKYRRFKEAEEVVFSKWGNSIAVRIPHEFIKELKIKQGEKALLLKEKKELKIIPEIH